jgi:hypothetical protein
MVKNNYTNIREKYIFVVKNRYILYFMVNNNYLGYSKNKTTVTKIITFTQIKKITVQTITQTSAVTILSSTLPSYPADLVPIVSFHQ